jgi:exopolysaccharide biosynthesis polyprenyl glycosylphosphotransferase
MKRLALDCFSIVAALAGAFLVRFGLGWFEVTEASPPTASFHVVASGLWIAGLVAAMSLNRLYDEDTLFPGGGELARIVRSVVEAGAILSGFVFLTQSFYVSRSWFTLVLLFSLAFLSVQRMVLRGRLDAHRRRGRNRRPAILIGRGEDWDDWPFEDEHEFEVVQRLQPEEFEAFCSSDGAPVQRVAVVLRARDFSHDEFWRILLVAGNAGWSVFVHSPVRSVGRDRLTLRELAGQTIVKVAPPTLTGARALQKRAFDSLVSTLLLVVLSPLLLVVAAGIVVSSGTPVLYRQRRVGLNGEIFDIVKFRTMRVADEEEGESSWTERDDPRRTSLGKFLRRTSIDELPQLWNVVTGDMSLVGPRPERPVFVGEFEEELTWYRFRHRIRPGITGWAQSHGLRGNTSLDSRVQFDNWYIENWSVWLDLKILALTGREVVRGRDAY